MPREIATDEHYILNGEKYLVSFEYQGQEMTTVYVDCGQFKNFFKRGTVKGIKVNESDEPLENALFGLFSNEETEFTSDNAVMTSESDSKGVFDFEDVPFGSYIVREITAPTGYVLSDESYPIIVSEDDETINIRTVNEKIRGNVTVTKIDEEYPDNRLSGAEFTVYSDEKCENKIAVLSETEKGVYLLENLEYGKYFLKETVAPDGFILDENVYPFTIKENGEIVKCSMTNTRIPHQTTPYTGDNHSNLLAWIMIGLSLTVGSVLFICKKKKGGKNEE